MNVLVIAADGEQQRVICEGLRRQDYRVELAHDGREAIARVRAQAYDVIILDLILANESSLLVLHEIRELNLQCRILVLSSAAQIRDRVTALIQGADDYLIKPFTPGDLCTRIRSLAMQQGKSQASAQAHCQRHENNPELDHLLEGLRDLCGNEDPGVELLFSEVRLSCLLAEVKARLDKTATCNRPPIRLPRRVLPSILVDASWRWPGFARNA